MDIKQGTLQMGVLLIKCRYRRIDKVSIEAESNNQYKGSVICLISSARPHSTYNM